jgi:hypothetical protein
MKEAILKSDTFIEERYKNGRVGICCMGLIWAEVAQDKMTFGFSI